MRKPAITPTLLALLVGCGGRSVAGGMPDSSGGDASVIDASAPPVADSSGAQPPNGDAQPVDLLAPCGMDRDVFYYDVRGYPGPYQYGAQTFTNHDSSWTTELSPSFAVHVYAGAGGGGVEVWTPPNAPLAPGTYPQGMNGGSGSPSLDLVIGDEGCSATSGTFTVVDLATTQGDAGAQQLQSFLASFDLVCGSQPGIPVVGCMRYGASP